LSSGRCPSCLPNTSFFSAFPRERSRGVVAGRGRRAWKGKSRTAMTLGLLGLKVGMTQVYNEKGKLAPVTVLQVGPCPVLQVRDQERDGYDAVQIGFLDKERRKATRAERGHVSANLESKRRKKRTDAGVQLPPKADVEPQRHIRECRL